MLTARLSDPEPVSAPSPDVIRRGGSAPPLIALPELSRARPWLERAQGECAFPVGGEGAATLSCCRPVARGDYCAAHRRVMFRPADPKEARELLRLVKALETRAVEAGR